jgi:transposase
VTIYHRDFNGARNLFLNVLDVVARVNGRPTTVEVCYECDARRTAYLVRAISR